MNLKDHVAREATAPLHYRQPFRIDAWACASDMVSAVFVRADLKVPCFKGTETDLASLTAWINAEPAQAEKLSIQELVEWAEPGTGTIMGVQVDRSRLVKLLQGIKGEARIWRGDELVGVPSLFLERGGVWKCLLAGYDEVDPASPVFDNFAEASLFDIAMGG